MDKRYSPNLSEENQSLQCENRRLRERLIELYLQINTLSAISNEFDINTSSSKDTNAIVSQKLIGDYSFVQTERVILQAGAIYSAALSPNEDLVALASLNGALTILSSTLKPSTTIQAHNLSCRDVFWGPPGLISCGFDKYLKIWDVEKQESQDIHTGGLTHSVCGYANDAYSVFCAAGEKVLWVDKRRQTPITIGTETRTTAVATYKDMILYGGYDGCVSAVDRRMLHLGTLWDIPLEGGAISSLSKVLEDGQCIVTTAKNQPVLLELGENVKTTLLPYEAPMRFGCRADITTKNLIFNGDFATVCGGRMAAFSDGLSEPILFEDVGGFDYGAIFISNIAQKVLTYSEDSVVTVYSLRQT